MSAETVIDLAYAALFFVVGCVLFRPRHKRRTRRPSETLLAAAGRPVGRVWDFSTEKWVDLPSGTKPGPGQMTSRQIEKTDPLELLYLAPAYDAELAAGCDRLRAAIRDEQEKGEQA